MVAGLTVIPLLNMLPIGAADFRFFGEFSKIRGRITYAQFRTNNYLRTLALCSAVQSSHAVLIGSNLIVNVTPKRAQEHRQYQDSGSNRLDNDHNFTVVQYGASGLVFPSEQPGRDRAPTFLPADPVPHFLQPRKYRPLLSAAASSGNISYALEGYLADTTASAIMRSERHFLEHQTPLSIRIRSGNFKH